MRVAAVICISLVTFAFLPLEHSLAQSAAGGSQIRVGADVLLSEAGSFEGRRIGLVTHRAGVTSDGVPTMTAIGRIEGLRLGALFAPEHGLDGSYDSGDPVPNAVSRGTPVYSLFGGTFSPTRQMLSRVDTFVVDLQDAGVRPFTYASTMALVMRAAADTGKPVVILDRPNPLGGMIVDGPVLEEQFQSFIGMYPIPYVHGMTLGELATLYNRAFGINAKLTVIPMQGWERRMIWSDTGLPWATPSPGLVDADISPYYAATGPFDGTNVWNGVATDSRFRVVLAPWIDAPRLAKRLNDYNLPGVRFTTSAVPYPHTGKVWQGVRLNVTDPTVFQPTTTTIHVLAEIRRMHGSKLQFRRPRRGPYLFDLVWGTKDVRLALQRGASADAIIKSWEPALERFKKLRETYLIYK
ncbi:MAG: exo-beta-N-acetylmuramidase NamZ family protein [bacterium]